MWRSLAGRSAVGRSLPTRRWLSTAIGQSASFDSHVQRIRVLCRSQLAGGSADATAPAASARPYEEAWEHFRHLQAVIAEANSAASAATTPTPTPAARPSAAPLRIPASLWTDLICAHAHAGQIDQACGLMKEQQHQSPTTSTPHERVVSVRAYISTLAACTAAKPVPADLTVALWREMHTVHGGEANTLTPAMDTTTAATTMDGAMLDAPYADFLLPPTEIDQDRPLPFAFDPDPRMMRKKRRRKGDTEPEETETSASMLVSLRYEELQPTLSFHFAPIAMQQFHRALQTIEAARRAGTLSTTQFYAPLEEFESVGRSYLAYWLAVYLDDLQRTSIIDRSPSASSLNFTSRLATLLIRSCILSRPRTEVRHAEALFAWMGTRRLRHLDSSFLALLQCYRLATGPHMRWREAFGLKNAMADLGLFEGVDIVNAVGSPDPARVRYSKTLRLLLDVCARASDQLRTRHEDRATQVVDDAIDDSLTSLVGADRLDGPKHIGVKHPDVPQEVLAPFRAAQALVAHLDASVLTPRLQMQLLTCAIIASEYRFALSHFQRQYNADIARMHACVIVREAEFEARHGITTAPPPRQSFHSSLSSASSPPSPAAVDSASLPSLTAEPEDLYFRANLDTRLLNGLMFCAARVHNPFHVAQLWELAAAPAVKPSLGTVSPFAVPIFASSDSATANADATTAPAPSLPTPTWSHANVLPNHATAWHCVSWIDALVAYRFEKSRAPPPRHTMSRKQRRAAQMAAKDGSKEAAHDSSIDSSPSDAAAPASSFDPTPVTPSSSPLASAPPSPSFRHNLPSLPTLTFSQTTLANASLSDLDRLIASFQAIETRAYDQLATPDSYGETRRGQSVWQPYTESKPFESAKALSPSRSSQAPSPLHLNVHFLPLPGIRANLEAVLWLSLRRIQSEYLIAGRLPDARSGWSIVHGHTQSRADRNVDDRPSPLARSSTNFVSGSDGYVSASRDAWQDARFKPAPIPVRGGTPPPRPGEVSTPSPLMSTNALALLTRRFLARVGLPSHTVDGNLGMTRVHLRDLLDWLQGKRWS